MHGSGRWEGVCVCGRSKTLGMFGHNLVLYSKVSI